MKNIWIKIFALCLSLLMTCVIFASCASKDMVGESYNDMESAPSKGEAGFSDVNVTVDSSQVEERKVIKTFHINTETKEYDTAISSLEELIKTHGGYVESSSSNNQSYNNNSNTYTRHTSLTVRVPAEKAEDFVSSMGDVLHITQNRSTVEDVSETYYSVEARLEELQVERDSLLEVLDQTATKKDYNLWLTVKQRLSEVTQQIAVYQGQLNRYDGQIAYSTIHLTVNEVLTYSVMQQNNSFGSRLGSAFRRGWDDFVVFCQDFTIWFAEALPMLLLFGGIATGIVFWVRSARRKKKAKKDALKQVPQVQTEEKPE